MAKQTLDTLDVKGKKVIMRCDFNVPMKDGVIKDDIRIRSALKSIQYVIDNGGKLILMSHLGRPDKKYDPAFTMRPVAQRLSELLGKEVKLAEDEVVVGDNAKKLTEAMHDGDVVLLENVRFVKGETKNDPDFAKALASLADIFVNDAFGTAHRAHSSTAGVADYLPSAIGFLIQKEVDIMGKALQDPERPFISILGGAKVSDKIGVIENLLDKVDTILIGGGMAYTFLKAQGKEIGNSLLEADKVDLALELIEKAKAKGVKLLLPIDSVVATALDENAETEIVDNDSIPAGKAAFDIGPKTSELFAEEIAKAKTIIWNGPMGVFEVTLFSKGTYAVAKALSEADAITIIGGGDSALAVETAGYADKITHVSTGGGASLEFLEGKDLPGISCISDTK